MEHVTDLMEGQSLGRAAGCMGEAPAAVESRARALCRSSWGTSHWPKQASSSSLWLMRISKAPQFGSSCRTSIAACTRPACHLLCDNNNDNKNNNEIKIKIKIIVMMMIIIRIIVLSPATMLSSSR